MEIRRAQGRDIPDIHALLYQVNMVHHNGRPDLFKEGGRKYSDEELTAIIHDDERPIFVCDEGGHILGYAFCMFQRRKGDNILTDITSLYIDDLCVDEKSRGKHIGTAIFEYVKAFAKRSGCYNLTLNVWSLNEPAYRFYEKCGLVPQKVGMETIL